jgi:F0F1-type ATP synthase membrane subunit b/b'
MIADANKKAEDMLHEQEARLVTERAKLETELNAKVYETVKVVMKKIVSEDKVVDEKFISSIIKSKE